jgi:hypothetical protein
VEVHLLFPLHLTCLFFPKHDTGHAGAAPVGAIVGGVVGGVVVLAVAVLSALLVARWYRNREPDIVLDPPVELMV